MALKKFRDKTKEKPKKNFLPFEERQTIARLIIEGHGYAECNRHYYDAHKENLCKMKYSRIKEQIRK